MKKIKGHLTALVVVMGFVLVCGPLSAIQKSKSFSVQPVARSYKVVFPAPFNSVYLSVDGAYYDDKVHISIIVNGETYIVEDSMTEGLVMLDEPSFEADFPLEKDTGLLDEIRFGFSFGSPKLVELYSGCESPCQKMEKDFAMFTVNKDGRISRETFRAGVAIGKSE